MRIKNFEFRQNKGDRNPEIVQWNQYDENSTKPVNAPDAKEYCYTLMWFKKDREGYYAEFVGRRPLDVEDKETLWDLMDYSQKILDAQFKLLDKHNMV